MTDSVRYARISRTWAFTFLAVSLVASFALEKTLVPDRGKALFFAIFMTGCAVKTAEKVFCNHRVRLLLLSVAVVHAVLVIYFPIDNKYAGAYLLPAAILDYVVFYVAFMKVARGL